MHRVNPRARETFGPSPGMRALPREADSQARSKITVAFQVNTGCKWLLVDPSDETCRRYSRLLGRNALKTFNMGLVGFTTDLKVNLQAAFPAMDFS